MVTDNHEYKVRFRGTAIVVEENESEAEQAVLSGSGIKDLQIEHVDGVEFTDYEKQLQEEQP